jgi:4-amino-4-deoxy-L-arabinose transferase-like glycosyltransferase
MSGVAPPGLARVRGVHARWLAVRAAVRAWAPAVLLATVVLLGLFFRLGAVPLFDVDEGAFGEATREMLARGDYVSVWLNGLPRFDKPILTYWLQAVSATLFGADEFALRLPSALAACGWIAAILVFGLRFEGRDNAWAAAFIAATTAGVNVIGRGAIADALLNLFLALAMFDLYRMFAAPDAAAGAAPRRRVYLWVGLGLLTKGPVVVLVPGAVGALVFGLHGELARWWRAARDPVGWLILLAVAGPWYALAYARQGDAFLAGFFLHHNVERFLEPLQGHRGGPLYYLPALVLLLLPWSGLWLAALPGVRRLRRDPLDTFLWCWFLFVLAFFSLAATKLPHYLLYGATPLFILMARIRGKVRSNLLAFGPGLLFLAMLAALPLLLRRHAPDLRNAWMREALGRPEAFGSGWQGTAVALLLIALLLACWRRAPLWPRLVALAVACTFAMAALLLPAIGALQQAPVKEAALLARAAGWDVQRWRINVPSFSLYRGAVTPLADPAARRPAPGAVILIHADALEALGPALGPVQTLYRKGGVVLLRMAD